LGEVVKLVGAGELKAWSQKDAVAKSFLLRTIKNELMVKIAAVLSCPKYVWV
jgi:hypothetical protein